MNPDSIERRDFFVGLRGYDRDEVHEFLAEVASDYRALLDEVHSLRNRALPAPAADPIADVGPQISAILKTATEQADDIRTQAHQQAAEITVRARDEADRVVREAEEHATHLRQEASAYADLVRGEADEDAERIRNDANRALERANEQAARLIEEAEARVARIEADAELQGMERAASLADAETAKVADAARQHADLRARLAEASDELQLVLLALGEPVADAAGAIRQTVLDLAAAEAAPADAPAVEGFLSHDG